MGRSRGTPSRRRLDELAAAARPPVVPPPVVVGGWLPSPEPEGVPEEPSAGRAPRRVPVVAAVAALALAVVVGVVVWVRSTGTGQVVDVPARPAGPVVALPSSPAAPVPGSPSGAPVVVDVEGRVRRPGLVRLPPGSRVADAVRSAGGASAGAALSRLNLARVVADGEQVIVPGPDDPVAAPSAAGGTAGAGPLDLNAATPETLDALPGVGPVLAGRIVAFRTQHGRFTSVDELGEVPGIGPKALERLRPLVRV